MASPLSEIPIAKPIAMKRLEEILLAKLVTKIEKLKSCCLPMATCITVANGLIMGSLWFLLMMCAPKVSFLRGVLKKPESC